MRLESLINDGNDGKEREGGGAHVGVTYNGKRGKTNLIHRYSIYCVRWILEHLEKMKYIYIYSECVIKIEEPEK